MCIYVIILSTFHTCCVCFFFSLFNFLWLRYDYVKEEGRRGEMMEIKAFAIQISNLLLTEHVLYKKQSIINYSNNYFFQNKYE